MNTLSRASMTALLVGIIGAASAAEPADCFAAEVEDHVLRQFDLFGPMSEDREYFGYIYRAEGVIRSAVTKGARCVWTRQCEVRTRAAAKQIPQGAKVLGEWHTHAHISGSSHLSEADVHGANDNRHIRCYRAFFGTSDGHVLSWDVNQSQPAAAMKSFVGLGSYRASRTAEVVATRH